jgi:hypothetical protein
VAFGWLSSFSIKLIIMLRTPLLILGLYLFMNLTLLGCAQPVTYSGKDQVSSLPRQSTLTDSTDVKILGRDSDNCTWVESRARVSFGEQDTKHQARAQAISEARVKAMERLLGVHVQHHFLDFQQESSLKGEVLLTEHLLRVTQLGRILKEDILSAGPVDLKGCTACLYEAQIKACILPLQDRSDKDFRVHLSLNQSRFYDGDEAQITVAATRDAYVYVYNVDTEWNASLIFPNDYAPDNRVLAGGTFSYPNEALRGKGIRSVARLSPGSNVSAEMIRVVATKVPLPQSLVDPSGPTSPEGSLHISSELHGNGSFLKLMHKLQSIDLEWVEDAQAFTIQKR